LALNTSTPFETTDPWPSFRYRRPAPFKSQDGPYLSFFDHPRVRSGEDFQSVVLLDDRGQILGFIIGPGLVYRRKHRSLGVMVG
jgi:hypothetical protein